MFKNGTIKERYDLALLIRQKTRKIAKIFGFFYMFTIGVLCIIAVAASVSSGGEPLNVGMAMFAIAGFPVGYLTGYILGSMLSWTEYWLEEKFPINTPYLLLIPLSILISGYVGIIVWLKYRGYYKKLAKEMKNEEALCPRE